ncbi:TPA: hypothetical protein N2D10_003112 [Clostridium botulinum]|nr:hypothetical protein [Clostridium botulinum]
MLREQCVEMIFDNDGEWQETKEHYEKLGYKIVDWDVNYGKKEFYLKSIFTNSNTFKDAKKEENKIDYDREYTINEIIELPKENVYLYNKTEYKINYGDLYYYSDMKQDWTKSIIPISGILKMKFKLVKKDKKVECIEAMKAFEQGKTIKVKYINSLNKKEETKEYIPSFVRDAWCIAEEDSITPYLIAKGQWYIKED